MAQFSPTYLQLLKANFAARVVAFLIAAIYFVSAVITAIFGGRLSAIFFHGAFALWLIVAFIVVGTWILSRFVRKAPNA